MSECGSLTTGQQPRPRACYTVTRQSARVMDRAASAAAHLEVLEETLKRFPDIVERALQRQPQHGRQVRRQQLALRRLRSIGADCVRP